MGDVMMRTPYSCGPDARLFGEQTEFGGEALRVPGRAFGRAKADAVQTGDHVVEFGGARFEHLFERVAEVVFVLRRLGLAVLPDHVFALARLLDHAFTGDVVGLRRDPGLEHRIEIHRDFTHVIPP
ncbi:hypothetical protein PT2222_70044 [Paraburkholderia tropica]